MANHRTPDARLCGFDPCPVCLEKGHNMRTMEFRIYEDEIKEAIREHVNQRFNENVQVKMVHLMGGRRTASWAHIRVEILDREE